MCGNIFEWVEKIFEYVAKYMKKWGNIWMDGKIFEYMGKYLKGWGNIWMYGKIFE